MAATLYSELLTGKDDVLPTEFPYEDYSLTELTHLLTRSSLHQYPPKVNSRITNFKSSSAFSGLPATTHMTKQTWESSLFEQRIAQAKGFNSSDLFLSPTNHFELEKHWAIWGRQNREAFVFNQSRGNRALNLSPLETITRRCGGPPSHTVTQQPGLRFHHRNPVPQSVSRGSGMRGFVLREKKECVGTGVFIPRRYGNPLSDSCKKQGCSSSLLQRKPPVHSAFLNENVIQGARRSISVTQQKYSTNLRPIVAMNNIELCLPQEWTY